MTTLLRHLKSLLLLPVRFVSRTSLFSRAALAVLLLPGALVYHNGLFSLARRMRQGRGAFAEVLNVDQELLREYLVSYRRPVRKLVFTSLAMAIRIRQEGSVKRTLGKFFKVLRTGGLGGIRQGVINTTPGISGMPMPAGKGWVTALPVLEKEVAQRLLVIGEQIPRADISDRECVTTTITQVFCDLGFEVVFLPMKPSSAGEAALQAAGVKIITRQSFFDRPVEYLKAHGETFGMFYLMGVSVVRAMLPVVHRIAPEARVICHMPELHFLEEVAHAKSNDNRKTDNRVLQKHEDELFLMSRADHVVVKSRSEAQVLQEVLPDTATSVILETSDITINRADLLEMLDRMQVLPLSLFQAYCQSVAAVVLPDPAIDADVDVSIIVPVYNQWDLTLACLASVAHTSANSDVIYEVILADDGSTDETVHAAERIPGLRVVKTPENLGFLRNCNHAARQARGRYIVLLNNDTVVLPGWLDSLYHAIEADESIAIAGSKLLYPDGHIQEAGGGLLSNGDGVSVGRWFETREPHARMRRHEPALNIQRETDYISGASILIRQSFWNEVGGFDERYENAYCEDSDLAMAARSKGMRVVYVPGSEVIHFEHQTYAEQLSAERIRLIEQNKAKLLDKWRDVFERDHLPPGSRWYEVMAHGERSISTAMRKRRESGKLNVLYFSPFPSHPASHGNQSTIQQFAKRFQAMGHSVHFVLLQSDMYSHENRREMYEAWDTFDILPNNIYLGSDGNEIPFDGWYEEGLGENIRMLCARYDIDVLFCSYVFQSRMLEYVPDYILKVIDTHDKMGDRYEMLREHGRELEFFSCTPEEEGAYLRRADVVVARREEEARYFDSVTGRNTAIVIPHVEEPRFLQRQFDRLSKVGTVASANQINLAIVRECLQAIDHQLNGAPCPFTVCVAGQVKDMAEALPANQRAIFKRPWVKMLGFVPDIADFYAEMDVIISPVTMGTGINVKTVQAMAFGSPLLTTICGSKGIETDDPMHIHADLNDLANSLLTLAEQPNELERLAKLSRQRYTRFYENSLGGMNTMFTHPKLLPKQKTALA